ncbi:MAG: helix-turn-helix domain-containing protein [Desulfobacteraceae bacterium]|jgi:transcriptional regulator with XRE-family HTH domain|nr:helix-turn-helix domain-containing protein [Desulfobacteraceae bacterium]
MPMKRKRVSSGITGLDKLLSGLYIGDNVIWYDDAGSLASAFCMKFIKESQKQKKPIVYVTFDRSPKNLIEKLGLLAENQQLTILDCFTNGKGDKAEVFNKFYEKDGAQWPYQVIKVTEPWKPEAVGDAIYGLHGTLTGDVRFVIESLTGMQDLWEGEEHILRFYSRSCPKLYELDTIAYWIIEKGAHSNKLKAHINQIAQVAIDLSIKRGKSALKILKAEKRTPKALNEAFYYFSDGEDILLEGDTKVKAQHDLGVRIKKIRKKQGMSQKELSKLIGVTPSNISQIESNLIYPSLPALYKIAENLSVEVSSFFQDKTLPVKTIFPKGKGIKISMPDMPKDSIYAQQLTPPDLDVKAEPYLIQILPEKKLPSHFFVHKGEELGYVLSGKIKVVSQNETHTLEAGDTIYLKSDIPTQWVNPGPETVKLLWLKVK